MAIRRKSEGGSPNLEELCRTLWKEPLFHFSLTSKELFHSNFLAWLAERWPEQVVSHFEPMLQPNADRTGAAPEREYRHFDLVLRFDGFEPLIIENKVFSIPRLKQLRDYSESIDRVATLSSATRCLLSPVAPDWLPNAKGWVHFGYIQLIDRLKDLAPLLADATVYEAETVDSYVRMMKAILLVIDHATRNVERDSFQLPSIVQVELEKVRLADGCGKLRADAIRGLLETRLANEGHLESFKIESSLTRKKPLIEVFFAASDDVDVGWQLQESQWRLAIRTRHGRAHVGVEERMRLAEANAEWFDFTILDRALERELPAPRERTGLGPWRKFDPDFIYQYRLVPGISTRQVLEAGTRYAERAAGYMVHTATPTR